MGRETSAFNKNFDNSPYGRGVASEQLAGTTASLSFQLLVSQRYERLDWFRFVRRLPIRDERALEMAPAGRR